MDARVIGAGCLWWGLVAAAVVAGSVDEPVEVPVRTFEIEYAVNPEAEPLDAVQVWYTMDRGSSWHLYGVDADRQSPVAFNAPAEGLYGLYIVLTNATGPSSPPPTASDAAHSWVFVDYTAPVVQVHPPRLTAVLGESVLQIRWTALDDHLTNRPVELAYRLPPNTSWQPVTVNPVANTGRYDWHVPDGLTGPVTVRVTVRDRGGHRNESVSPIVEVPARTGLTTASLSPTGPAPAGTYSRATGRTPAQTKARELHREALELLGRGDDRAAIMQLREAVRLDPTLTDAFAELGGILYRVGDSDGALDAYELALQQNPALRSALIGAAEIETQQQRYTAAARRLRQVLSTNRKDVEVWMNLGDLALLQGDQLTAKQNYLRAVSLDPEQIEIVAAAQKRLKMINDASRVYPQGQ